MAVSAGIVGGDLLISYADATDVLAEIVSDGTNYTVSGTGLSATQFPLASVTGRIGVTAGPGIGGQTFQVLAGNALANPLQVTAAIETTNVIAGINATRAGDVIIDSGLVSIGSGVSRGKVPVSTAVTNGNVTFSGAVRLNYDTAFTSGSGTITLGSVGAPGAVELLVGDTNQSGAVTVTGNVELPNGYLVVAPAAFDLALEGQTNHVASAQLENTGTLEIGRAGGTSWFREGLVATAQAAVSRGGVVETVNGTLQTGDVTLVADTTLLSGSSLIQTGAVTDGASAFTLSLGSTTQTGEITLGGNVTLDGLSTAAGSFAVALVGDANDIARQVTFTNTLAVKFGDDTHDVTRIAGGVTATSQTAGVYLGGTVRTDGGAIDLGGLYLTGNGTLDTSGAGADVSGAAITLRNGARLEGHVLTTIGGVGETASATRLLGTGAFGSGTTDDGSLVVQAGSLFVGLDPSDTAALTIANDTTIQVTAGSLHVMDGSTIDATGATLNLVADDISIASAAGSIDATRFTVSPVTAGRNIYLGTVSGSGLELGTGAFQAIDADEFVVGGSGYTGTVAVGTLTLADTTLAIVAGGTGGRVSLQGSVNSTGGLSLAAPQITLAAVVLTEGPITISDGAGGDAAILLGGNAVLDTTHENANKAGNAITIQGTVTASAANNYIFVLKGGTDGDVVVTNTIGVVGGGVSPGPVSVTGNDITLASVDRVNGGLFIEASDGTDAGSVRLTGTTYRVSGSIGIAAGARDPVTNALTNVITLAGGATGATTTVVTTGADVELNGTVDLAGRNLAIDTTNAGGTPRGSTIWIYDAVDGGGALTLDSGTAGDILVNHLTGETGATTPLSSITVTNANNASFSRNLKAGTVRIVDATGEVVFSGTVDIQGGLITEAQAYGVRLLGGNSGSSRIAGTTTFQNTGALWFGDQGPPDVITFVGGLAATACSEIRLTASILAETGSIVLGDADTAVSVLAATVGGAATAVSLSDVVLLANGGLILGTGLANTVRVGTVTGTEAGFADSLTFNTTGTVTVTGSVGGGLDRLIVTNSGGTTFEAAVVAGEVSLADTTGTITFQGNLTAGSLFTAANDHSIAFQGAATTVANAAVFLNTGSVSLGNEVGDVTTFTLGLNTANGPGTTAVAGTLASSGNVSLGTATLVTDVNFQGPLISFGGSLSGGTFGLTTSDPVSPDGGDAAFDGAVTVGFLSVFGTTSIAGPSITTGGGQNYLKEVTLTAPAVVLRGASGVFGGVVSGPNSSLELDFDDGASLPQPTLPPTVIGGTFTVSDGIVRGSSVVGSFVLTSATTLQVAATGIEPGSGFGQVSAMIGGTVTLGSATLSLAGSSPLPMGSTLRIIDNGGAAAVNGTFAGLPDGTVFDSPLGTVRISYQGGDGNDVTLEVVPRNFEVGVENNVVTFRLAGAGTTIRDVSTRFVPATRRLVITVAADRPLVGGGTGLVVNPRAGTVTVNLAELPGFTGIAMRGTGATDRITVGPRGVNLAALTGGAASQIVALLPGQGADVVTIRNPVRTKGAGGVFVEAPTINVGTLIKTDAGEQRYYGHVR
ncbi:MAG: beta strand repeat-containing protein, partial [Planctomycetia bacterium]